MVFSKSSGNPIFGQIFGHQRAKNEARGAKMNKGQGTHPIRVNAMYEMNWANIFFKKFRKPCLQTDGRTYGWTDRHRGESSIPPFHLRWSEGIKITCNILSIITWSHQFRDSHDRDKTVSRPSYLYHGNPIPGKTVFILKRTILSPGDIITGHFIAKCEAKKCIWSVVIDGNICRGPSAGTWSLIQLWRLNQFDEVPR